jgi:hypothetical protein
MGISKVIMENSMAVSEKKLKIELPYAQKLSHFWIKS